MMRFLPRSLAGRTVIVLITGLIVTHIATTVVFSEHRAVSLTRADEQHIAQHIGAISKIVFSVPDKWRDRIVRSSDDHAFRVFISSKDQNPTFEPKNAPAGELNELLSRKVRSVTSDPISIKIQGLAARNQLSPFNDRGTWLRSKIASLLYGHDDEQSILVSVPMSQGKQLNFSTVMPLANAPGWERTVAVTGSFVVAVIFLSLWAVRRLSAPLLRFAAAATTFAQDVRAPALPETGPSEVREAARAFNDMQRQVLQLIENRDQMLAAISHDLRTPLTTVRLRAESITEHELRTKILTALKEMDTMLSSTLAFAREGSDLEVVCMTDIGSLVESICEDMRDVGEKVTFTADVEIVAPCRPFAIKRALSNVISNAVKYGKCAYVSVRNKDDGAKITIEDEGPGIPESEMERVFHPFFRLETSRSRDTGGAGLGLAIAQTIIDSHGGSVRLANRPEGGLQVRICLPCSS